MTNRIRLDQYEYSLEDPQFFLDPARHEVFAELRKNDPVSWRRLPGDDGYWAVVRYADIKAISLDVETYSSAHGVFLGDTDPMPGALITADPPRHNELRGSVVGFFIGKSLSSLEDWLRAECKTIIKKALEAEEVEFVYDVAAHLPLSVIGELMQISEAERHKMLSLVNGLIGTFGDTSYDEKQIQAQQEAAEAIGEFALDAAKVRRAKEGSDLISSMLIVDGRELTEAEFKNMFLQIAVAATETTRSTLAKITSVIAKTPELMQQLSDPDCNLDTAINEFLRYYPPVNHVLRTATRDHELGGKQIKAGDKLVLLYPSANFDEEVFDSPQNFDIKRLPNPHLTFGIGPHICLGFRLARKELKIFLEEFFNLVSKVELLEEPVMAATVDMTSMHQAKVRLTGK